MLALLVSCTASNQIPQVAARPLRPQRRRIRRLGDWVEIPAIAKACKTEANQRRPKGCPPPCKPVERGTARRDDREATSNKSSSRLGAAAHRLRRTRAAPSNDVEPGQRPAALRPLGPVAHQMGARRSRSSTTDTDQARDQQTVSEDPAPRPVEECPGRRLGWNHSPTQRGRGAHTSSSH